MNNTAERIAIVPGSFDPMTLGHLSVVIKAAGIFDKVIVAIMNNSEKRCTFSLAERKEIAQKTCESIENVRVVTADGLLVDLARAMGARYLVKGVRNSVDFEYEQNMAKMNKELAPEIQTIYLPADTGLEVISSSFVRELMKNGRAVDSYVHPDALPIIINKMNI